MGTMRPPGSSACVWSRPRSPMAPSAFHPKSWLFEGVGFGVAFVGSSNLSASALGAGIEWNLRVERGIDAAAYRAVRAAVEGLWASAIELSAGWINEYAERVRERPRSLPPGDGEVERLEAPPLPHEFQEGALRALAAARAEGRPQAFVALRPLLLSRLASAVGGGRRGGWPRRWLWD
jgi:hypothetical protein